MSGPVVDMRDDLSQWTAERVHDWLAERERVRGDRRFPFDAFERETDAGPAVACHDAWVAMPLLIAEVRRLRDRAAGVDNR